MAANLIGVAETHADGPGAHVVVMARKLEMLRQDTRRLMQRGRQRESATRTAAELLAGIDGATMTVHVHSLAYPCSGEYDGRNIWVVARA